MVFLVYFLKIKLQEKKRLKKMKNILALIFLISSITQAQYIIKGTLTPSIESDWVLLYKVESGKQQFVKNTQIKIDTVQLMVKKAAVEVFAFYCQKTLHQVLIEQLIA